MFHNIGEQDSNINTGTFGQATENSTPQETTNQENISSSDNQEINGFTIDLVRKYINEYKLNVLPTKAKTKIPDGKWTEYQNRFLTEDEINLKFQNIENEDIRVGVVCGSISGGLEVIDFDNKFGNIDEVYNQYLAPSKC